jgi:Cd2+/Zn2+-exporting ATPase
MGTVGTVSSYRIAVGNIKLMENVGATVPEFYKTTTNTYILCAKNAEFIGAILIEDELRDGARSALDSMRRVGIERLVLLSGDRYERAEKIAGEVGIDEVFAPLLPEGKFDKLEEIITASDAPVMFVGDGINDAPSLSRADVGVAMGGIGSDSAIESADLVITSDNLAKIPEAVKIARKTLRIAKQNIVFAIGVKLLILALGALGFANMWLAVFADVGVAVIAILNSMRTLLTNK